jgi:signal transduction histidine kinase
MPPILITGIWAVGVPQPVSELGETSSGKLKLAHDQNQLRIEFAGLDFRPGDTLRYQYQLEGADRDWSAPAAQRTVIYPHLAAGTYRFLVRAVNSDGIASLRPADVSFVIFPPLWQRAWFLALALLAASGIVWTAHRFRVQRLLQMERLRTRIATDLHDDIGASLSQIAVLAEVVRRADPDERVTAPLAAVGNLSRDLLDAMNDIVWAINPKRDYLGDLISRMRRFAADALSARGIDFRFGAPESQDYTRLGGDLRREIFLIFKESVNNIVRHSRCSEAAVQLLIQPAYVRLTVRDNGEGFDPARAQHGNGLGNMHLRAARLGGKLDIAAAKGEGVTVTLTVPLARGCRIPLPHIFM